MARYIVYEHTASLLSNYAPSIWPQGFTLSLLEREPKQLSSAPGKEMATRGSPGSKLERDNCWSPVFAIATTFFHATDASIIRLSVVMS